jgi:hypothetical protein
VVWLIIGQEAEVKLGIKRARINKREHRFLIMASAAGGRCSEARLQKLGDEAPAASWMMISNLTMRAACVCLR